MADDEPKIRHEFVAIIFALAASEVASQAVARLQSPFSEDAAGWAHLVLMLMMIAASWVGWSNAHLKSEQRDATKVWSPEFFLLLADVTIVIVYFMMVKGWLRGTPANDAGASDFTGRPDEFFRSDTFGMVLVFGCYFIWDLIVARIGHLGERWRLIISTTCLALCFGVWFFLHHQMSTRAVVAGDFALLGIVLLFRAWQENLYKPKKVPPELRNSSRTLMRVRVRRETRGGLSYPMET
jgi:hypothetical protein